MENTYLFLASSRQNLELYKKVLNFFFFFGKVKMLHVGIAENVAVECETKPF